MVMWAHPRSMSTAMERMMRERGDCDCLHEPFMYYYYVNQAPKEMPFFKVDPDHPVTFRDILDLFEQRAKDRPVFVKDMAYYIVPEIFSHPELAGGINHIFLIRNLRRSIVSYFELDQGISSEEIGVNAQWALYQWVRKISGKSPLVLSAEHVQSSPASAAEQLCRYLGLPTREDALEWNRGEIPGDWEQVSTWHEKTSRTSGIQKDKKSEASVLQHFQSLAFAHTQLTEFLADHTAAYESLKAISDDQWQTHLARSASK